MLKQYAEGLVPNYMVLSNKIFDVKYEVHFRLIVFKQPWRYLMETEEVGKVLTCLEFIKVSL